MKIAVVMYTNGALSGGAAKYLHRMMPRLLENASVDDIRLFLPHGALSDIPGHWPVSQWKPGFFRGRAIRRLVRDFCPDVVFVPSARWIDPGKAGAVVMVRNMEPLERPVRNGGLLDMARQFARRWVARQACARADRVIAVSQHVADWLKSNWNLDSDRITVIPHGVDTAEEGLAPSGATALAGKRFIFSAGSIRPARGLMDLIQAMAEPDFPDDLHLVFAGRPDTGGADYYAMVLAAVEQHGLDARVHWLGQCAQRQMDWGFQNCDLFVMTSRAEACPNIVLEALSAGCLSVSCDTQPMPEFFGPAALYYESGNSVSLAAGVCEALALPAKRRDEFRRTARERAALFSWEHCATQTRTLLADVHYVEKRKYDLRHASDIEGGDVN